MTGYRDAASIGARIQALRKARGLRTAKELAEAIDSPNLTESVIENIEAGRKADLPLSQLFNIAFALDVAPIYLLVPLEGAASQLDLPNLSPELAAMSPAQFDSWLAGIANGSFRPKSAADRASRVELEAVRELNELRREQHRLRTVESLASMEEGSDPSVESDALARARTDVRQREISAQIELLDTYLRSAGWEI